VILPIIPGHDNTSDDVNHSRRTDRQSCCQHADVHPELKVTAAKSIYQLSNSCSDLLFSETEFFKAHTELFLRMIRVMTPKETSSQELCDFV
jgi:hypothetical protein